MTNKQRAKTKRAALRHYDKMISWVEEQIKADKSFEKLEPDSRYMEQHIKQHWDAAYCSYCITFEGCDGCLLDNPWCCGGEWQDLDNATTWKEWLYHAKQVRKYIGENG